MEEALRQLSIKECYDDHQSNKQEDNRQLMASEYPASTNFPKS
jgi:hypothetical protein